MIENVKTFRKIRSVGGFQGCNLEGVLVVITQPNVKIYFFCFIRLNFAIEMAKIPNFSHLLVPQANSVNFNKK